MTKEEQEKKIEYMGEICSEITILLRKKIKEGLIKKIFTEDSVLNDHLLILNALCTGNIKHVASFTHMTELQIIAQFVDNLFR